MKGILKVEINARDIGGRGFVQENIILSKLDEIITHNNVTTNQITGESKQKVLHLVEDKVSYEEEIIIFLQEERDND